ncbi:MAG: TIGR02206 family membrane protein [Clostridiales bacterium]|nr:TIGR02206 family membrane protein [Clostridiales bacterium]
MSKYFQYLEDTAKPGDGFQMYGGAHIIFLIGIIIGIVILILLYNYASDRSRLKMLRVTAAIIFISEAVRQASFVLLQPVYPVSQLPLHLCGLSMFIEIIHAVRPNKTTGEILYSLGLPGALAALLFPNWTMYPLWSYQAIQSFVVHGLHIAFVLMPLIADDIRPSARNIWRPALFLLIIVPPIYFLNKRLNTNFFFVNAGSEGSPLEILINLMGNPGFLFGFVGLLLVLWFIMYLPFVVMEKKRRRMFI